MTKLVWRLGKLPSVEELRQLVTDKIITQEEARDILFNTETEEERDKKSLESEIKFLRELVDKLSQRSKIVEVIREVEKPYYRWEWYKPYAQYCQNDTLPNGVTYNDSGMVTLLNATSNDSNKMNCSFSSIKTF